MYMCHWYIDVTNKLVKITFVVKRKPKVETGLKHVVIIFPEESQFGDGSYLFAALSATQLCCGQDAFLSA